MKFCHLKLDGVIFGILLLLVGTFHYSCWRYFLCAYSGDILGVLLDLGHKEVVFSLNGNCLPPFKHLFRHATYVHVFFGENDNVYNVSF